MTSIISKELWIPNPITRVGCPAKLTSKYQVASLPEGSRTQFIQEYTAMKLTHMSKNGKTKNSLPLEDIHYDLETNSFPLAGSGSSNILLSKVSFDCLVKTCSGEEYRDYLTFDLRIPGTNSKTESVFSYEMIEKIYGGRENLYALLKYFYTKGFEIVNPTKKTHGHLPDYDPSSSNHDQYIRHTEQLLAAYLLLPEGANMLCNRLRTAIRGKFPDANGVKVYNMVLHMHSTKSCCAPCEYVLVGLMNEPQYIIVNNQEFGFLPFFKHYCSQSNDQLNFTFPKGSPFRVLVTVTANNKDADHKKQPKYTKTTFQGNVPTYDISVKHPDVSSRIFTTMLKNGYDLRRAPSSPTLSDKTVGISGSKATRGSPGTMNKVKQSRENELQKLGDLMSQFTLDEKEEPALPPFSPDGC